jgi:hypothetical protein
MSCICRPKNDMFSVHVELRHCPFFGVKIGCFYLNCFQTEKRWGQHDDIQWPMKGPCGHLESYMIKHLCKLTSLGVPYLASRFVNHGSIGWDYNVLTNLHYIHLSCYACPLKGWSCSFEIDLQTWMKNMTECDGRMTSYHPHWKDEYNLFCWDYFMTSTSQNFSYSWKWTLGHHRRISLVWIYRSVFVPSKRIFVLLWERSNIQLPVVVLL